MKDGSAPVYAGASARVTLDDRSTTSRSLRSGPTRDREESAAGNGRDHGGTAGKGTFADALARMRSNKVQPAPARAASGAGSQAARASAASNAHGAAASRSGAASRRASPSADARHSKEDDPLDPSARRAAQLAPPQTTAVAVQPVQPALGESVDRSRAPARASLEAILPSLVKRIAWSGDARRGTVRLELGAGALAGATLLIESNDGRVDVQIAAPPGVDVAAWRERIARRLADRGVDVGTIAVD